MPKPDWKHILPSVLSAACYASAVIFVRFAYNAGVTPGTAIFLRFTLAVVSLGVILWGYRLWRKLAARQVVALLLLGFFAYTVLGVTWFEALRTTPVWLISLIGSLYPLVVNLASWVFLNEKATLLQLLALAAVLLGAGLIFWQPFDGAVSLGIVLMVVNILVQSAYVLVGQRYTRQVPPVMSAFWMITGAALGTFFYSAFSGQLTLAFSPAGWLWVGLFAVFSTALAITFLWWGIGLLGPGRAAIIGSLEPLFSITLALLLLGESLSPWHALGGALILAGVLLVQF
jgi:drug/metabolite transporter (DMT)-like permease